MMADKPFPVVPRLRFPDFRNAGEWQRHELGEFAEISKGKGISKSDLAQDGRIPCVRYGELYTSYGEIIGFVKSTTNLRASDLILSNAGDVIIPSSGETKEEIATCACVVDAGVALGSDLNVIRSPADGRFFSYYLNGSRRRELARFAQGVTVAHLYPAQLSRLEVDVPDAEAEQQRIADCLGSLDDLIAAEGLKLEALRLHKTGLIKQLFPQPGETVPRLRFRDFRGGAEWETKKFGSVVARITETFDPKKRRHIPHLIGLENIESKTGRILGVGDVERQNSLKSRFQAGDILFGKLRPYLRKFARPDFPGVCTSEIWVLRGKEISSAFLFYLVQTERFIQLANVSSGSRMPRAEWNFLTSADFGIPHPDEQRKIADCLASLDDRIAAEVRKLESLRQHKQGLMQQMFPTLETD